ncbi:hypothetical protein D3C87_1669390 [compost metagenome]
MIVIASMPLLNSRPATRFVSVQKQVFFSRSPLRSLSRLLPQGRRSLSNERTPNVLPYAGAGGGVGKTPNPESLLLPLEGVEPDPEPEPEPFPESRAGGGGGGVQS